MFVNLSVSLIDSILYCILVYVISINQSAIMFGY